MAVVIIYFQISFYLVIRLVSGLLGPWQLGPDYWAQGLLGPWLLGPRQLGPWTTGLTDNWARDYWARDNWAQRLLGPRTTGPVTTGPETTGLADNWALIIVYPNFSYFTFKLDLENGLHDAGLLWLQCKYQGHRTSVVYQGNLLTFSRT